ncbi:MAG TPA: hypothetical protein VG842_13155 [Sediminibacterium sp.]|nr:hypothetical protein [Sediminibacterium sp.]
MKPMFSVRAPWILLAITAGMIALVVWMHVTSVPQHRSAVDAFDINLLKLI